MAVVQRAPVNDYNEMECKPFHSAEGAWFWYCKCAGRYDLASTKSRGSTLRPCTADDVYLAVAKLYHGGKIGPKHIEVLLKYGKLGVSPDGRLSEQLLDARFWDEALDGLKTVLIAKGVVEDDAVWLGAQPLETEKPEMARRGLASHPR